MEDVETTVRKYDFVTFIPPGLDLCQQLVECLNLGFGALHRGQFRQKSTSRGGFSILDWENFELTPCEGLKVAGKYQKNGDRLLLLLPGFGNDRHWFDHVLPLAPPGWTLAVMELPPFYGSGWTSDAPLGEGELKNWIGALHSFFKPQETHLMAFSLGSRAALGMYLSIPESIASICLISPDGLRVHPAYAFAMYTSIGRMLFRRVVRNPVRLLFILRLLNWVGIIHKRLYDLALAQLESESRRKRLYYSWIAWSGIRPKINRIAELTQLHGTRWRLIWGKQDEILPHTLGRKFCRHVTGATLHLEEGGHFLIRNPSDEMKRKINQLLESNGTN
jgi:pimeloyl-ACP methyl ester carboxylesterase